MTTTIKRLVEIADFLRRVGGVCVSVSVVSVRASVCTEGSFCSCVRVFFKKVSEMKLNFVLCLRTSVNFTSIYEIWYISYIHLGRPKNKTSSKVPVVCTHVRTEIDYR